MLWIPHTVALGWAAAGLGLAVLVSAAHEKPLARAVRLAVHWTPRLVAAVFASECFALAWTAWHEGTSTLDRAVVVGLYVLPGLLAVGIVVIARWSSRTAGALCFALAMLYAVLPGARMLWIILIATPMILEGVLLVVSSRLDPAEPPRRPSQRQS